MSIRIEERAPGNYVYTTDEDLWLSQDGLSVVEEGTKGARLVARAGGSISGREAAKAGLLDEEHTKLYEYSSSVTGKTLEPDEIVERHFARVGLMEADDDVKARARVAGAVHVVPGELTAEQRKQLAEDLDLVISEQTDATEAHRLRGVQKAMREEHGGD